ncbi:hypothetical protein ACP70R_011969 [Stipagrostis hirtigluma subsp. patula]
MPPRPCLLIPILFAAAAVSMAVALEVERTRLDNNDKKRPSIYLVVVHGEPLGAAFRRGNDRNATWYNAQKRRASRHHGGIIRRGLAHIDGGRGSCCRKLYGFHHAISGFAVHATTAMADRQRARRGRWWPWRRTWGRGGRNDGEGVVVGVIDSGVDPAHPSFVYVPRAQADSPVVGGGDADRWEWPFYGGACDVGLQFSPGSCNGKIVIARYFATGDTAVLRLDASRDLSPFDADGHGRYADLD